MPRLDSAKMKDLHKEGLDRFDLSYEASRDERELALSDRRFFSIAGAMWEGAIGEQFDNRIKLEANKILLAVTRIFNEYRNNRIAVEYAPKDGRESDGTADLCMGLYRADEQDSQAQEAYDNAFDEGTAGGMGAWRLCAEYEDPFGDDDDRQRIRFEPIYDADCSVFLDANAKRYDKSDAMHGFVLQGMSHKAYEDQYDENPTDWPSTITDQAFDWSTPDQVFIAEYYVVKEVSKTVYVYREIDGTEIKFTDADFMGDDDKPNGLAKELNAKGTRKVREKSVKKREVNKYILSGGGVLEDCGRIAGTEIPIVLYYGKRWFVDGRERFQGEVRPARDMQMLTNMQMSMLAETAAGAGQETPIVTPAQIAGNENAWASRAVDKPAYLTLNPLIDKDGVETPSGPISYTQTPQVSPAAAALIQLSQEYIQEILGSQQNGEQMETNPSGKAVELIQNRLDFKSFGYMDNMGKSVRRCGQIWLGMASEIYADEGRVMKTIGAQGERDQSVLMRPVLVDGIAAPENDIRNAKLDVSVDVGPTSSSKRSAIVRALTQMMQLTPDPADQKILMSMAMQNMEGEGIGDVREYYRKQSVQLGVSKPTDKDKADMAAQQAPQEPDAQTIYLQAEAEKSKAMAVKANADAQLAVAKTAQAEAETQAILAAIPINQRDGLVRTMTALRQAGTTSPTQMM